MKLFWYYFFITDNYTNKIDNAVNMIKSNEKARLDFMGYEMDLLEREMRGREDMRKEMNKIMEIEISKKNKEMEMEINKKIQELEKMQNEIVMLKKQIAMMS